MEKILKNSWALFTGMGLIMIAHGFQVSLLGVRAVHESFSLTATGFMLSGYFVGYFIGAKTVPILVSRVGHIRVFAAFASIASIVVLVHSIIINPFTWFILRIASGFSMVCLYTIAESWLNDRASNKNRGSVLSIYMIVLYASMAIGMFFLNFSKPENFQPFILVSLFMSLSLVPILLTKKKPPKFKKIIGMKIKELYEASPFGMVSALLCGICHSAMFALIAVYAASMNFSIFEISVVTGLYAFFSLPMFALIFAHTNDFIAKEKFVAAGAGLQFTFGMGAISGPFLCSMFMDFIGENGYFIFLIIFHCLIGAYGVYRMKVREVVENPDSQFTPLPTTITPIGLELNPATEPIEDPIKPVETEETVIVENNPSQ